MPTSPLYPLHLQPQLHIKVWGGRKLATHLHKSLTDEQPYGESWEIHDTATVTNGPLAGQSLGQVLHTYGQDLVGADNTPQEGFPLLAKFLDAQDWLSIQVHPNDEQAIQLEGDPRGKTEAWIILAAEPNAQLVIGLRPGADPQTLRTAIQTNTLENWLVYQSVHAGDVLYLPANTVHAIGPGLLIYEIQQSSDVTYRLYDWGRLGLDGQPRPLHIEKGLQIANLESLPPLTRPNRNEDAVVMVAGDYFQTIQHRLQPDPIQINTEGQFHALTCIQGTATVTASHQDAPLPMKLGESVLVPASLTHYGLAGNGLVLCSYQNKP